MRSRWSAAFTAALVLATTALAPSAARAGEVQTEVLRPADDESVVAGRARFVVRARTSSPLESLGVQIRRSGSEGGSDDLEKRFRQNEQVNEATLEVEWLTGSEGVYEVVAVARTTGGDADDARRIVTVRYPIGPPRAPSGTTVRVVERDPVVFWCPGVAADAGFAIERSQDGGLFSQVGLVFPAQQSRRAIDPTSTSQDGTQNWFEDDAAPTGSSLRYRVVALTTDEAGDTLRSSPSNETDPVVLPPGDAAPSAPMTVRPFGCYLELPAVAVELHVREVNVSPRTLASTTTTRRATTPGNGEGAATLPNTSTPPTPPDDDPSRDIGFGVVVGTAAVLLVLATAVALIALVRRPR